VVSWGKETKGKRRLVITKMDGKEEVAYYNGTCLCF